MINSGHTRFPSQIAMPDNEQSTSPAEATRPTTVISQSGGVDIDAQRDVTIGGDVVGRYNIVGLTINIIATLS